jgi:hypothetical protein
MSPYAYQPKIQLPTQNQTSIALFHIPSDAKNSIYVDGVPNDTTEREVSRNNLLQYRYLSSVSWISANQVDPQIDFHRKRVFALLR